ncbi:pleckstrin (PH) domain superfamily protein [Artemisia annua]|uniref:Pleckstrin (PH) domain superfamily protein n=1 Tax=Artemisia annua TaxID=35608 RepID=A0A2U1K8Z9_ARTAN|nr:pleckstrin (PH) domain superfamily protein [Artemisia annua]
MNSVYSLLFFGTAKKCVSIVVVQVRQSATSYDSLVAVYRYKPFDAKVDWSMVAKASLCCLTEYIGAVWDCVSESIRFRQWWISYETSYRGYMGLLI